MVAGPLVDHVHRLTIMEIARLRLSIIEGIGLGDKVGFQLIALVHVDGISDHHLCQFVEIGCLGEHLATKIIDAISASIAKAQYLINLCLRLTSGSVVQHTQGVGDADG